MHSDGSSRSSDSVLQESLMDLKAEDREYLRELAKSQVDATVQSHQATLNRYHTWYCLNAASQPRLHEATVARFAKAALWKASTQTLVGNLNTLANFLAYHRETDPAVVQARIANQLEEDKLLGIQDRKETVVEELHPSPTPDQELVTAVEALLAFIRQRQYGTRLHVFVELLVDAHTRPHVIIELDRSDYDRSAETLEVGIPDTHAVGAADLVSTREVGLSSETAEALNTYLDYERITPQGESSSALLTTARGRVSADTVRRSLRQASRSAADHPVIKNAFDAPFTAESETEDGTRVVTPREIRAYALTHTLE